MASIVIGASGAIGGAVAVQLETRGQPVWRISRSTMPALDLLDEASIEMAAEHVRAIGGSVDLVFDATGFLHGEDFMPERSWRALDPDHMLHDYRLNTVGPALLMKHFLPLLRRDARSVFATLSARVGSISDNRLGGWHSYRASKAALNQMVRTCSIELARKNPKAVCVAVHPGTVASRLSEPFSKSGLDVRSPDVAAGEILGVLDALDPADTGKLFDHKGKRVEF